jgi:tetratricopeptide (TPR) repeat protein
VAERSVPATPPPLARVVPAVAVLALFYFGLFRHPPPSTSAAASPTAAAREAVTQAQAHMRAKRYREALLVFRELHALFPTNHTYASSLAEVYHALGNPAREAAAWEAYLEFAPLPTEACPQWPRSLERAGKREQALAAYERCHRFDTEDPDGIFFYALALERAGHIDDARAMYERGLAIGPNNDIAIGLARLDLRAGRPADALGRVEPVLIRRPNDTDALLIAGLAALRVNNLAKAETWLKLGLERQPRSVDFHLGLGMLAEKRGSLPESADWFERALHLKPDNQDAARSLARVKTKL